MKTIKKLLLLFLPLIIIMMMFLMFLGGGVRDGNETPKNNLSSSVEYYRPYVSKIAKLEGMEDYVDLILAVMQVESGGTGGDPMQASEGPFNKKYPQIPNGIKDPHYSIRCGIKELQDCLKRAKVKDASDEGRIRVALGGYNFGNGFIEWIDREKGGRWTLEAAKEFSDIMKGKTGWSVYGDPPYADKVMSYYDALDFISGDGTLIPPLKGYTLTSGYGNRPSIGDFHYGVDLDGSYGASIYAPGDAKVYQASSSCPADGGYLGNMCPGGAYAGAGNFIQLKMKYKGKELYILLCHMKDVDVKTGQSVKKGQRIGSQGHSGNSTASHVHMEMHFSTPVIATEEGSVDPGKYIKFK